MARASSKDKASVTLQAQPGGPGTSETLTLDPVEYPCLTELLMGAKANSAQRELTQLIGRYWQARSTRRQVQVLAKMVVPSDDGRGEEVAVYVQDISGGGIRVAVLRSVNLLLMQLTHTRILVQTGAGEDPQILELPATFVRLAGYDDKYAYLASRFEALDTGLAMQLDQLSDLFFS